MKSFPIASLALVLVLSACASSPSVEEQTKLIEYESCLAVYEGRLIENLNRFEMPGLKEDELINASTKYAIEKCAEFRPKR